MPDRREEKSLGKGWRAIAPMAPRRVLHDLITHTRLAVRPSVVLAPLACPLGRHPSGNVGSTNRKLWASIKAPYVALLVSLW